MGKRFVDTEMVLKQWWRNLPPPLKALWEFLRCRCDAAGVWPVDRASAEFHVGVTLPWDTLPADLSDNHGEPLVEEFTPGKWWIPSFCDFQYGEVKENYNPHKPVVASLAKHGLVVGDLNPPKPSQGTKPTPSPEKAVSKPEPALLARFDTFWAAYPKKYGKGNAKKVWRRLKPSEEMTTTIIAAVEAQKEGRAWIEDGGKYIPYPTSWLNREGWEDEVETKKTPNATAGYKVASNAGDIPF